MVVASSPIKQRILVIDDEAVTRRVLGLALRDAGYDVEEAGSAEDAVAMAATKPFDLALVDKNLPGMSGLDGIAAIRRASDKTVALLMTAYPSLESLEQARTAGAIGYVLKPFEDLGKIVDLVRMVFTDGGKSAGVERTFSSVVDEIRRLKSDPPEPSRK